MESIERSSSSAGKSFTILWPTHIQVFFVLLVENGVYFSLCIILFSVLLSQFSSAYCGTIKLYRDQWQIQPRASSWINHTKSCTNCEGAYYLKWGKANENAQQNCIILSSIGCNVSETLSNFKCSASSKWQWWPRSTDTNSLKVSLVTYRSTTGQH